MLKAQKTNLVTETEYHNKEDRVKVRAECFIRVYGIIYSLTFQAVQDNVGNGIDAKPSTSSVSRTKQEHSSEKMLVGDEADVTGSSNTAKEKPKSSQSKEHSKATEPESKSSSGTSRSDDKKASSSEKSTKSSTVNGPTKSDHTSKRTPEAGTESQGMINVS